MTYTKPNRVSYTDMAIWIDHHMHDQDVNQEMLYEYLYHLAYMLAHERGFYNSLETYDEFALYSASKLFLRVTDPRQYTGKLQYIKSILNYLKAVIYPYKIDFDNEFQSPMLEDMSCMYTNVDLADVIAEDMSIFDQIDFKCSIDSIDHIIKLFLRKIPFRKDTLEWENIYLSCMLTFLNSITCSRIQLDELAKTNIDQHLLTRQYKTLVEEEPVLYHLDKSMAGYVKVLVNELKEVIARELTIESQTFISSEASMKTLIIQMIEEANGTDNE